MNTAKCDMCVDKIMCESREESERRREKKKEEMKMKECALGKKETSVVAIIDCLSHETSLFFENTTSYFGD